MAPAGVDPGDDHLLSTVTAPANVLLLAPSDGLAHFHMDPDAHGKRTVAIVGNLFDETYRYDEADDEWRVD